MYLMVSGSMRNVSKRTDWNSPALPFTSCMALGKSLKLHDAQFLHLKNEYHMSDFLMWLWFIRVNICKQLRITFGT